MVGLPTIPEKIVLTLHFTAVTGAASYRIYRTPTPGLIAGDERLLIEIPAPAGAPTFTDNGLVTPVGAQSALPLGTLGVWHTVGTLSSAREGAGVVAVPDPNLTGTYYLYVVGGRNAAGTALATYEWATLTAPLSNRQLVGGFATGGQTLPSGRWQVGAVYTDATRARAVPATDAWVYVLPGMTGAGGSVDQVTAFQVDTLDGGPGPNDGRLGPAVALASPTVGGGYGYLAGNNYLFQLGAANGSPSAGARSAKICDVGEAGCTGGGVPEPPEIKNWNAGISLDQARYLHATAAESGFVFLVGGQTAAAAASASTERTNF